MEWVVNTTELCYSIESTLTMDLRDIGSKPVEH
jgi:hypothetical protein